jgi:acetyl esterase/lipase
MYQWKEMSLEEFPSSEEKCEGMNTVTCRHDKMTVLYFPDVEYAKRNGMSLHLHILKPFIQTSPDRKYPLIVYVQGSAWRKQMAAINVPQLAAFAKRGYTVAMVEYRPSDVSPFPAQAQDARTAIRFMKKNADKYSIDPSHTVIWGDSSGGHTALMAGLTAGTNALKEDDYLYPEYSDTVNGIVDFYGPTDVSEMSKYPTTQDHNSPDSPEGMELGHRKVSESVDLARKADPASYITPFSPPILIMHGSKDRLVPFNQSVIFYNKLIQAGCSAEFWKLEGSDHATSDFWEDDIQDTVEKFIKRVMCI